MARILPRFRQRRLRRATGVRLQCAAAHEPAPHPFHRPAPRPAAAAVGGQRGGRPHRRAAGAAAHAELPALGARLRDPAALRLAPARAREPLVGPHRPLCGAGPAGRGLLQRAAIPRAEDLHPDQRDAGGLQHPRLHARDRRGLLRAAHHAAAGARRRAVHRGRSARAVPRRARAPRAGALRARRPLHAARNGVLGSVQLAAHASRRPAGDPLRLGRLPHGATGARPGVVGPLRRGRDGGRHADDPVGAAARAGAGLRRDRPGAGRLPLLGRGRAARRAEHRELLLEPHAAVRGGLLRRLPRRAAAPVPRARLRAHRRRHRGDVAARRPPPPGDPPHAVPSARPPPCPPRPRARSGGGHGGGGGGAGPRDRGAPPLSTSPGTPRRRSGRSGP